MVDVPGSVESANVERRAVKVERRNRDGRVVGSHRSKFNRHYESRWTEPVAELQTTGVG